MRQINLSAWITRVLIFLLGLGLLWLFSACTFEFEDNCEDINLYWDAQYPEGKVSHEEQARIEKSRLRALERAGCPIN